MKKVIIFTVSTSQRLQMNIDFLKWSPNTTSNRSCSQYLPFSQRLSSTHRYSLKLQMLSSQWRKRLITISNLFQGNELSKNHFPHLQSAYKKIQTLRAISINQYAKATISIPPQFGIRYRKFFYASWAPDK